MGVYVSAYLPYTQLVNVDFVVLMWVGAQEAKFPYDWISLIASTYWFAYFLVILPLLGVIEKPLPQPETIEDDFKDHYGKEKPVKAGIVDPSPAE